MTNQETTQTFSFNRRVYHSNTDSAGVVYYGDYFIFFEEARAEWLRAMGFNQASFIEEFKTAILVKSVHEMHFIKPARMDDLISIECELLSSSKISFSIQQIAYNASHEKLVSTKIDLLCVDSETGRPKRTPKELLDKLT